MFGLFSKKKKETLDKGLEKTKTGLLDKIKRAIAGRSTIDEDFLDELEYIFISSDIGPETSLKIIDRLKDRVARDRYMGLDELYKILYEEVSALLTKDETKSSNLGDFEVPADKRPYVIMVVGVNGVGKTTTIGKLAHLYKRAGNKVMLGAADTFRAAASEQLEIWADRAGVPIVSAGEGADPAAVIFDTVKSATARGYDMVIADTAGRLHNKSNLMAELSKISRSVKKASPEASLETLLVLDAITGQNAISQAEEFCKAASATGVVLTKLDGTPRGGCAVSVWENLGLPIRFIGVGEKIDDLMEFDAQTFVESLLPESALQKEEQKEEGEGEA